jgi:hypothetical protein
MADIIHELQQKLLLTADNAENMHAKFDGIQLSIFRDTKNNVSCAPPPPLPNGRRYTCTVKEFATTLNYYSPKAYPYVRSILPLPHASMKLQNYEASKKLSNLSKEAFESLQKDAMSCPEKQDCWLIIDTMSTRDSQQDKCVGFVYYGTVPTEKPDILASEAVVFLLVGAKSHWKCPTGYFLADKMSGKTQAQLVRIALEMAAEAGLRVWSITTDGNTVNISMFRELGCNFTTSYDSMVTKFKHTTMFMQSSIHVIC